MFFRYCFLTFVIMLSGGVQASLEDEKAVLSQLTQALEDAKASLSNLDREVAEAQTKAEEEQKAVIAATSAKDAAAVLLEAATTAQAASPSTDNERALKDAEYEVMMAERKLSSAEKSLERAEKKLDESKAEKAALTQQITNTEKSIAGQKELIAKVKTAVSEQAQQKAEDEKARKIEQERLAAEKAAEKAAEEARKQAAAAEAAAKKEALKQALGVDLEGCTPFPAAPPSSALNPTDLQLQPFALGELRRVNRLLEEAVAGESAPLNPAPVLSGSKLKPCDVNKWQAFKFSYLGSGQYRLETPVLAGEQEFSVKGVVPAIRRVIPEGDHGAVYVFFLDVKYPGRYKLSAFKKALFDQSPEQGAQQNPEQNTEETTE